jgi:glycerol-3-phosphate dehydrogenase
LGETGSGTLSEDREKEVRLDRLSPEMRALAGDSLRSGGLPEAHEPEAPEPGEALEEATEAESADGAEASVEEPAAEQSPPTHRAPSAPHVLIIGGGMTGATLAHDLILRGLRVTLVEKGELTSGTTGRHQGLLHSGARYATTDRAAAIQCVSENKILRRIAPGSFEENDGLFVAISDEDADFSPEFVDACWQSAVPTRRLSRGEAIRSEPGLNPELRLAVQVPDATMDAMRLPLRFFATARANGADIRPFSEVVAMDLTGTTVSGVRIRDRASDREYQIGADLVVNATGPWAGRVASLAGAEVPMTLEQAVLVAVRGRHTNMVVSRLHAAGDADTVVPQRQTTLLGIARTGLDHPDKASIGPTEIEMIRREASSLVTSLAGAPIRAKWTAVRPLSTGAAGGDGAYAGTDTTRPDAARESILVDHRRDPQPIHGLVTIVGPRATTMRATAQAAADAICARFDVERPCETAEVVLLPHTAWYSR